MVVVVVVVTCPGRALQGTEPWQGAKAAEGGQGSRCGWSQVWRSGSRWIALLVGAPGRRLEARLARRIGTCRPKRGLACMHAGSGVEGNEALAGS